MTTAAPTSWTRHEGPLPSPLVGLGATPIRYGDCWWMKHELGVLRAPAVVLTGAGAAAPTAVTNPDLQRWGELPAVPSPDDPKWRLLTADEAARLGKTRGWAEAVRANRGTWHFQGAWYRLSNNQVYVLGAGSDPDSHSRAFAAAHSKDFAKLSPDAQRWSGAAHSPEFAKMTPSQQRWSGMGEGDGGDEGQGEGWGAGGAVSNHPLWSGAAHSPSFAKMTPSAQRWSGAGDSFTTEVEVAQPDASTTEVGINAIPGAAPPGSAAWYAQVARERFNLMRHRRLGMKSLTYAQATPDAQKWRGMGDAAQDNADLTAQDAAQTLMSAFASGSVTAAPNNDVNNFQAAYNLSTPGKTSMISVDGQYGRQTQLALQRILDLPTASGTIGGSAPNPPAAAPGPAPAPGPSPAPSPAPGPITPAPPTSTDYTKPIIVTAAVIGAGIVSVALYKRYRPGGAHRHAHA
jgi:hypothetical protein